jgi:hypothetical protein
MAYIKSSTSAFGSASVTTQYTASEDDFLIYIDVHRYGTILTEILENAVSISGATQANPVVITTSASHGYENGDTVDISAVVGMTEINGRNFTVANKTATTFELQGEDGTAHTAYTSGGDSQRNNGWTNLSYNKQFYHTNSIWYRKASAIEPTSITADTGGTTATNGHGTQLIVFGGVDTTTPFDVSTVSRTAGASANPSWPAITPVTANSLIFYICLPINEPMIAEPGPLKNLRSTPNSDHCQINTYYTYSKGASVTVPALSCISEKDANIEPPLITIALRDDGNGLNKAYVDVDNPPVELIHMLGRNGETGHLSGTTTKITNLYNGGAGPIQPTIQGITPSDNTNSYAGGLNQFNFEEGITASGYSSGAGSPQECGLIGTSIVAAKNLENEILSLSSTGSVVYYDALGVQAKHFFIGDGTNYRAFQIDALDSKPSGSEGPISVVFEVDGGFESEEYGTVTSTVLQNIDNFAMSGNATEGYQTMAFGFLYKQNTMLILGGSTTFPASMETAIECSRTGSLRTVSNQNQQSTTQYLSAQPIQVGDGTIQTIWSNAGHSIAFPGASNVSERRIQVQVSEGNFGITWKASASCDFDIRGTFHGGNYSPWGFESGTSTIRDLYRKPYESRKADA